MAAAAGSPASALTHALGARPRLGPSVAPSPRRPRRFGHDPAAM